MSKYLTPGRLIGFGLALVSLLLLLNKYARPVAVWAAVWIIGVMLMRGKFLKILEEAGFLWPSRVR